MSRNDMILLVVNPISGGMDKADIINFLKKKFEKEDRAFSTYYTTGNNDEERLKDIVQETQPNRVLIIGGDGTIKLLAEIIKETWIPIGLLPAGSANGLAANLELPDDLELQVEIALGNNFMQLDCISVNGEICLHISDIGLNAELIRNYEEGNIRGKLGYFLQTIPTLLQSEFPFRFHITIEGRTHERVGFLLAIANARKYGTGAVINPIGKMDDGQFEILVFKKFNIPQILRTFQAEAALSEDFMEVFPAKRAEIECGELLPFQVDGEYLGEVRTVKAEISNLRIKMAVPNGLALK